jgi:hypothetical protein
MNLLPGPHLRSAALLQETDVFVVINREPGSPDRFTMKLVRALIPR